MCKCNQNQILAIDFGCYTPVTLHFHYQSFEETRVCMHKKDIEKGFKVMHQLTEVSCPRGEAGHGWGF